jgi:hypothetical protein
MRTVKVLDFTREDIVTGSRGESVGLAIVANVRALRPRIRRDESLYLDFTGIRYASSTFHRELLLTLMALLPARAIGVTAGTMTDDTKRDYDDIGRVLFSDAEMAGRAVTLKRLKLEMQANIAPDAGQREE